MAIQTPYQLERAGKLNPVYKFTLPLFGGGAMLEKFHLPQALLRRFLTRVGAK
jgi:hypothetical protein